MSIYKPIHTLTCLQRDTYTAILSQFLLAMGLLMTFLAPGLMAAEIRVSVDRNPVQLNESFNLIFSASESPDDDPDFSILGDQFEIINQSQSSNISVINGSYNKEITWTLTVMAKRAGSRVIPSIPFGDDMSAPTTVRVLASAPQLGHDEEIFLEVSAEPKNPYVQAQVIYTMQLFRRIDFAQASLTEPVLAGGVVEKLGEDSNFSTERNGVLYSVTQRKYAIFPQKSGPATIEPLVMTADILTTRRSGFFNRQTTRSKRIVSKPIGLNVKSVPSEFTAKHWLPAEELHLSQSWSEEPPLVKVGEPITRTVTLLVKGAQLSQLPELPSIRIDAIDERFVKQYPDQPVLQDKMDNDGIVSFREQKTALILSKSGEFNVRGIEIPWWNTKTNRMQVTRLEDSVIQGLPSLEQSSSQAAAAPNDDSKAESAPKPRAELLPNRTEGGAEIWRWISLFLALGWGVTLMYLFASNRHTKQASIDSPAPDDNHNFVRQLKQACSENNPDRAKDALLGWAKNRWPDTPPGSLSALALRCDGALSEEVQRLSRLLYSPVDKSWSGAACWDVFKNSQAKKSQRPVTNKTGLEPLYKV